MTDVVARDNDEVGVAVAMGVAVARVMVDVAVGVATALEARAFNAGCCSGITTGRVVEICACVCTWTVSLFH